MLYIKYCSIQHVCIIQHESYNTTMFDGRREKTDFLIFSCMRQTYDEYSDGCILPFSVL